MASGIVLDILILGFSVVMWPRILLSRKQPVAMLSWLLGVTFIPVAGPIFFLLFGRETRLPGLPRKKLRADRRLRLRLGDARQSFSTPPVTLPDLPDHLQGSVEVARRVGLHPLLMGNRVELLDGAREKYPRLLEDIAQAREHVHLEYFILREDAFGRQLAEALLARALAGVAVRVLLDGVGSRHLSRDYLARLAAGGVQVVWFHPLNPFQRRWSLNIRNHRKLAVMDGRVGYVGGINLGDEYLGLNAGTGDWHDLSLRVEGPVVVSLQRVFSEDWHFASEEVLEGEVYVLPRVMQAEGAAGQVVNSFPSDELVTEMHQLYFALISGARDRVWLMTPYFVPDEAIQLALASRALAGVDVRVLVPERSPERILDFATRSFFPPLLESGVRVFYFPPEATLHAKALLVDDALSLVGSANLDHRSMRINFETGLFLPDFTFAATLSAFFDRKLSLSRELTAESLLKGPLGMRTLESLARLAAPLF
ncbi:MAG: cardiolipin synthase [Deltaproteobacteria bacterium]|nr:cardiolipin synthase [Deltaproteobacteria bacterium]